MRLDLVALFVIAVCGTFGDVPTLKCRLCNRASTLSDCNSLVSCDSTLEDCFLDELITDQLTVVYEGGCRSKQICALGTGSGGKTDLVACSRCCSLQDECNKRLCGIKDDTVNATDQCYSCNHRSSYQSEVSNPDHCVTFDICQPNEVCYSTQADIAGRETFSYGCLSKSTCDILMQRAYEEYKVCVVNATKPSHGLKWVELCGGLKRSTVLCHSCCADGGCNYGTCMEQNARIFKLALQGRFDMKTLKAI